MSGRNVSTGACAAALIALAAVLQSPPAGAQTVAVPTSQEQVRLSFAPVVRKAAPAVVNVYVTQRSQRRRQARGSGNPYLDFFNRRFRGMPRRRLQNSLGSGVIVSPDGVVITNHHVIRGGENGAIKVVLSDKREFPARILLKEEKTDLAVMRIEAPGVTFPYLDLGDSDQLQVGDIVLAIGNPFGVGQTVTSGIVSALARTRVGISDYQFFIQTDAAINPGNSGGALVDVNGRLVGVNTAIFSRTGASHGIGFAIPSNMAQLFIQSAVEGRQIVRPWLGARLQPVTRDIAASLGLDRPAGALVSALSQSGPARKAGLRRGDVIVSVDGKHVDDPRAFRYRFATKGIGGTVPVGVLRDGEAKTLGVPLVAAPEDPPRDTRELKGRNPLAGARVANISPALAEELSLKDDATGVVILEVRRGTPASAVGFLRRGDILVAVNGDQVSSSRQLEGLVRQPARRWRISVRRGGRVLNVLIGG